VHIDGLRERHDASVCKEGVFDEAVAAIKECKRRGFRVTTNTTFFNTDTPQTVIDVLDYLNDDLAVDEMMISSARRSRTGTASAGGSTTRRCSSTSSRARPTSAAPRGGSPPIRFLAGSGPAT
jgi:sulfatase maturation enzyme AslB (radical SAM superfamily)